MEKYLELSPIDGRKSFNGKAKVIINGDLVKLISYETIVATYRTDTKEFKSSNFYSNTTSRHIKAFRNLYNC